MIIKENRNLRFHSDHSKIINWVLKPEASCRYGVRSSLLFLDFSWDLSFFIFSKHIFLFSENHLYINVIGRDQKPSFFQEETLSFRILNDFEIFRISYSRKVPPNQIVIWLTTPDSIHCLRNQSERIDFLENISSPRWYQ